jgi:uncharacterized SAM-dependent methyltransferase
VKYFKNTELAKLYNVSEKSVRNWVEATRDGKLELTLIEENGHAFIANTTRNVNMINELADKGKKFRNTRGYRLIQPSRDFYKQFTTDQIFDIISCIDTYHEIPHKYSYFDGGAEHWDKYTHKLLTESTPNLLTSSIELLRLTTPYIDRLVEDYKTVNVIDIGVGNGLPVRKLLEHLIERNKLGRYIALDISNDMLHIAKRNMNTWFGDKVKFEGYIRDVSHQRFRDILLPDTYTREENADINLFLFLGGTLANFRKPDRTLSTIHDNMTKSDVLVSTMKLDSPASRRYFDFAAGSGAPALDLQEKNILDCLNIEESFYSVEQFFDEKLCERRIQVRFNIAVSLEFELEGQQKVVNINKDDVILLWRYKHQNLVEMLDRFERNEYETLQLVRSKNQECLLVTSRIKVVR